MDRNVASGALRRVALLAATALALAACGPVKGALAVGSVTPLEEGGVAVGVVYRGAHPELYRHGFWRPEPRVVLAPCAGGGRAGYDLPVLDAQVAAQATSFVASFGCPTRYRFRDNRRGDGPLVDWDNACLTFSDAPWIGRHITASTPPGALGRVAGACP